MKYKDEMEVVFWHGTNRDGVAATHQSNLRVEIVSPQMNTDWLVSALNIHAKTLVIPSLGMEQKPITRLLT